MVIMERKKLLVILLHKSYEMTTNQNIIKYKTTQKLFELVRNGGSTGIASYFGAN